MSATQTGPSFDEIGDELQARIKSLCKELIPDGVERGGYWIGRNPTRGDRKSGSFWVRFQPIVGVWKDEATGDQGDVIKLIMYVNALPDYKATRQWAMNWLGWSNQQMDPASRAANDERRQRVQAERAEREKQEQRDLAERQAKRSNAAFAMWLSGEELRRTNYAGGMIDTYLQARGINLVKACQLDAERKPRDAFALPGALRFSAAHDYYADEGEVLTAPCMMALMSAPDGTPQALHRTWLSADFTSKADFGLDERDRAYPARKIFPTFTGSVIRLSKGKGGLTPERAGSDTVGTLVVAEGIEDGLSIALSKPDARVWAAGTLGNLAHVPILPCVNRLIIWADNDWGKPQAMKQFNTALNALRKKCAPLGIPVAVARASFGKDANDLLKGSTE